MTKTPYEPFDIFLWRLRKNLPETLLASPFGVDRPGTWMFHTEGCVFAQHARAGWHTGVPVELALASFKSQLDAGVHSSRVSHCQRCIIKRI